MMCESAIKEGRTEKKEKKMLVNIPCSNTTTDNDDLHFSTRCSKSTVYVIIGFPAKITAREIV